jgi:hypothetical protein
VQTSYVAPTTIDVRARSVEKVGVSHDYKLVSASVLLRSNLGQLFNPAGGLPYHWRALCNAGRLWMPFRSALGLWLEQWQPSERHLVLVGPSAGYNLPLEHLRRYTAVTVLEPDPIARWLFARRVRRVLGPECPDLCFEQRDYLVEHPVGLSELFKQEKRAVLFCNVLGQLPHLVPATHHGSTLPAIKLRVRKALQGRSWASFHDRVSGPVAPTFVSRSAPKRWSDAEVIAHAYDTSKQSGLVELNDHHTHGLFPSELRHTYLAWQIQARRYHLIEAVHQVA